MARNNTVVLGNDEMRQTELSILTEMYGKEEAEKIVNTANTENGEQFDSEVQEILDEVPSIDEL